MVFVRADLLKKRKSRCRNLLQQKLVCTIKVEECGKFGTDFLPDCVEGDRIGHQPVEREEHLVENSLVTAILGKRGHEFRRERCDFYRLDLIDQVLRQKAVEAGSLGAGQRLGQKPKDEARESLALFGF